MTARFYDELAPYFHLLYGDWENAVRKQGSALSALLDKHGVKPGDAVLDAACGIGTQTLGLVLHGYRVTASDISEGALQRLRSELSNRSLHAEVYLDDLRIYLTFEAADGTCETRVLCSRYYAVSITRLSELLMTAGFVDVQRDDHVLHQPTLVARKSVWER